MGIKHVTCGLGASLLTLMIADSVLDKLPVDEPAHYGFALPMKVAALSVAQCFLIKFVDYSSVSPGLCIEKQLSPLRRLGHSPMPGWNVLRHNFLAISLGLYLVSPLFFSEGASLEEQSLARAFTNLTDYFSGS